MPDCVYRVMSKKERRIKGSFGAWPQPRPHPGLALSERRESEGDPGIRQVRDGQAERLGWQG